MHLEQLREINLVVREIIFYTLTEFKITYSFYLS